jgi:hypothetical protein
MLGMSIYRITDFKIQRRKHLSAKKRMNDN